MGALRRAFATFGRRTSELTRNRPIVTRNPANSPRSAGFSSDFSGKAVGEMNPGRAGRPFDAPQSKWGRHCCRPHSHRRVVPSPGEPFEGRLAPDVSPPLPEGSGGSLTGARTGIRFRPRFGRSEDRAPVWRDRNRTFHEDLPSRAVSASTEAFAYPIDVRPDCPADSGAPFAAFSNGSLASGRSLCHAFLEHPRRPSPLPRSVLKSPSISGR